MGFFKKIRENFKKRAENGLKTFDIDSSIMIK